jgi:hypothetical protein
VPVHLWLAWLLPALMQGWTTIVFHLQSSALHLWLVGLPCAFMYIWNSHYHEINNQVPLCTCEQPLSFILQPSALHLWLVGLLYASMCIWSGYYQLISSQVPMHLWLAWLLRVLMHIWTTIIFHSQSSMLQLWLAGLLCVSCKVVAAAIN